MTGRPPFFFSLGIVSALSSAALLGLAPIFGKLAILAGLGPIAVVAWRTALAALLTFAAIAAFRPKFLFIYPAGLVGCLLAGAINGAGSLFYYAALGRLDASPASMLYALYPLFIALLLVWDGILPSKLTLLRLGLGLAAVVLLTGTAVGAVDWLGAAMMLVGSFMYALHLIVNQHVLYDMPSPTVALYTLVAMTLVVVPAHLFLGGDWFGAIVLPRVWGPIAGLTAVTFLSRLAVFAGVKRLGGLQTALLGLSELLVTVAVARWWLGESLTLGQWIGGGVLLVTLGLVAFEPRRSAPTLNTVWLRWIRPPRPELPADVARIRAASAASVVNVEPSILAPSAGAGVNTEEGG